MHLTYLLQTVIVHVKNKDNAKESILVHTLKIITYNVHVTKPNNKIFKEIL